MPSILPGYEYDIFISYRQNDNKRDSWVTNFVQALRDELEATLKNPVSIYFDENPHDGLLESHQVAASLEGKLKCIVFIPIVSQTYCDEQGYAWSQEFLPFIEKASSDGLGMNIKLANGNVASRVLPIKIHDLDAEDQSMLQEKLGGPLRSIDFIYKEPGVNRPLRPQDNRELNQEKTSYHNQLNKVANALKEIGTSVLTTSFKEEAISQEKTVTPIQGVSKKRNYMLIAASIVLIGVLGYFFSLGLKSSVGDEFDYDIAVIYFENLTDDEKYDDGLVNLIQINLAEDTSLNLVPRQQLYDALKDISSEVAAPDQSVATELAASLNVQYMVIGRVIQQGLQVLAQVELIEISTGKVVASKKVQAAKDEIFSLADDITAQLMQGRIPERDYDVTHLTTSNYTAYQYFYEGLEDMWDLKFGEASTKLSKAIELDSTFAMAYVYKAIADNPFGDVDIYADPSESRATINKAMSYAGNLPNKDKLLTKMVYDYINQNPGFTETLVELIKIDPYDKLVGVYDLWSIMTGQADSINLERRFEMIKRNPNDAFLYNDLAYVYLIIGEKDKAIEAVDNYLMGDPELFNAYHSSWEVYLMAGKPAQALKYAKTMEEKFSYSNRFAWRATSYLFGLDPDSAIDLYNLSYKQTLSKSLLPIGGSAYMMKGQWSRSLSSIDEVMNIAQDSNRQELEAYLSLAKPVVQMVSGQLKEALKSIDIIIESSNELFEYNPYFIVANYYKGLVYLKNEEVEMANQQLSILKNAITEQGSDKRFVQFYELLSMEIALEEGRLVELEKMLSESRLGRIQNSARFYSIRLQYLMESGQMELALDYLDNIHAYLLAARPTFGGDLTLFTINLMNSNFYRGQILEALQRNSEAIEAYSAFLELLKSSETELPEINIALERISKLSKL